MTKGKRSLLLAAWRHLRPRSLLGRVLVLALPLLLLLAFLDPVLGALRLLVGFVGAVFGPVLRDPQGRLAAVCVALALAAFLAVHLLRGSVRSLRAGLTLRHHLDAVAAWLRGDLRRAADLWRRVARSSAPLPPEYRAVRDDAQLKLARLALDAGVAGDAFVWVLRVNSDGLPPPLARAHAQLRARAVVATRESLPESCRRELDAGLARWPDDLVLLRLQRDRLLADGDLAAAARLQERVARAAEPAQAASERDAVVQRWLAAAASAGDDLAQAEACVERARAADAIAVAASGVDGDLRWRRGDLTGALRAWAKVPGSGGLARAAAALDTAATALSPREILEACPTAGGLLLAARAWARAGAGRQALRAAQRAARLLGPSPTVSAVLAEVLRATGDPSAAAFAEEAVARLPR